MRFLALLLVASLAACAGPLPVDTALQPHRAMTSVTSSDLDPVAHPVLFDALSAKRPTMLRSRGGSDALMVEVDGAVATEGVSILRSIRTADVASVERVSGASVTRGAPLLRVRLR